MLSPRPAPGARPERLTAEARTGRRTEPRPEPRIEPTRRRDERAPGGRRRQHRDRAGRLPGSRPGAPLAPVHDTGANLRRAGPGALRVPGATGYGVRVDDLRRGDRERGAGRYGGVAR